MVWEAIAAALVGLAIVAMVLQPLLQPPAPPRVSDEPEEFEETVKGVALTALKEIEFDRETGKLSDADYAALKARYTAEALAAMRAEERSVLPAAVESVIAARVRVLRAPHGEPGAIACPTCGPRPEADAVFCSTCGVRLGAPAACSQCGCRLTPDSRFCERCGVQVAA
jgi:hypothetical protein